VPGTDAGLLDLLARVAPGTPLRTALERIIQQSSGALVVLGDGPEVAAISSGGFRLQGVTFSPPRLAELAKMDGGIVIDDDWDRIIAANVHFLPDSSIPTDETGSRHRTAERVAIQTGKSVVAVSETRRMATLFFEGQRLELARPTVLTARINQDLQTLERLRRRLDDADERLTLLEVTGLATYRSVVNVVQQGELLRRVGHQLERETVTLGGEARLIRLQLAELMRGVDTMIVTTLADYLRDPAAGSATELVEALRGLADQDLDDPAIVAKVVGFPDLDDPARPRGVRLLSKVARIPEAVRSELLDHFPSVDELLGASAAELEEVEGIGATRAAMLLRYFDRWRAAAAAWEPESG
jgi:diadenylate cyclase